MHALPPPALRPSDLRFTAADETLPRVLEGVASDDFGIARAANAALLDHGRRNGPGGLVAHLSDARFEVRACVAFVLGELGATGVGAVLLAAVADPSWPVRARVAEALGRLQPDGAEEALRGLLLDPHEVVADAAVEALARVPSRPVRVSIRPSRAAARLSLRPTGRPTLHAP